MTIKIIVSSIGSPAGYGVVKCLKDRPQFSVIGIDANPNCPGRDYVSEFYAVPKNSDINYLERIKEIIDRCGGDLFIPTIQPDLAKVGELNKMIRVLSSSEESIELCNNKNTVYERLKKQGLTDYVPRYCYIGANDSLDYDKINKLGYPGKAICLKPASEHGGLSFKIINLGTPDLVAEHLFGNRDNSWRTYGELIEIYSWCPPLDLMAMEYLPGEEYSVDLLLQNNEVIVAVPRKRVRVSGGIVTQGYVEKKEELIEAAKSILPLLNLDYFVNVQFKYADDGSPKLIDINPRFCGSHIMSYGAGINFPLLAVKLALDESIDPLEPAWGRGMIRYWESLFFDFKV